MDCTCSSQQDLKDSIIRFKKTLQSYQSAFEEPFPLEKQLDIIERCKATKEDINKSQTDANEFKMRANKRFDNVLTLNDRLLLEIGDGLLTKVKTELSQVQQQSTRSDNAEDRDTARDAADSVQEASDKLKRAADLVTALKTLVDVKEASKGLQDQVKLKTAEATMAVEQAQVATARATRIMSL
jgi:hypothetical protein